MGKKNVFGQGENMNLWVCGKSVFSCLSPSEWSTVYKIDQYTLPSKASALSYYREACKTERATWDCFTYCTHSSSRSIRLGVIETENNFH